MLRSLRLLFHHCQVLRKDSGSTTQGRIESMELSAMWADVQQHQHRETRLTSKSLTFYDSLSGSFLVPPAALLISALSVAVSVDRLCQWRSLPSLHFQGVGEEPTLSNEAIHNMDGYDKCILVSGHFQKRKAYRTHYGLLKGRFSSLAHSAMGCSMR